MSAQTTQSAQPAPNWSDAFDGDLTVIPSCVYLGRYRVSPVECSRKFVLSYKETEGVTVSDDTDASWFMSAVTTVGRPQETGRIVPAGSDSDPVGPDSLSSPIGNLTAVQDKETGVVDVTVGPGVSLIPEAVDPEGANILAYCPQFRLKDPSTGLYVSVDGCLEDNPVLGLAGEDDASTLFNAEPLTEYQVITNHEEDAEVSTALSDSNIIFYATAPNETTVAAQAFPASFAYLGLDEYNKVISFVCPQLTAYGFTLEVQIGQVGGRVDPTTGAAYLVLDDVNWLMFGDVKFGPDAGATITKENGISVALGNVTGGTQLVLPAGVTSETPSLKQTVITALVPAETLQPDPNMSEQNMAILESAYPLLPALQPGAQVFWALYLEAPESVTSEQYLEYACDTNQGTGPGGTANETTCNRNGSFDRNSEIRAFALVVFVLFGLWF